jgi:hypothetical protein
LNLKRIRVLCDMNNSPHIYWQIILGQSTSFIPPCWGLSVVGLQTLRVKSGVWESSKSTVTDVGESTVDSQEEVPSTFIRKDWVKPRKRSVSETSNQAEIHDSIQVRRILVTGFAQTSDTETLNTLFHSSYRRIQNIFRMLNCIHIQASIFRPTVYSNKPMVMLLAVRISDDMAQR